MNLNALGYVGIRTRNLEDWASYGTRFLGMQRVDQSRGTLALRMDDRSPRIWKNPASRWRAARARLPTSAASRI